MKDISSNLKEAIKKYNRMANNAKTEKFAFDNFVENIIILIGEQHIKNIVNTKKRGWIENLRKNAYQKGIDQANRDKPKIIKDLNEKVSVLEDCLQDSMCGELISGSDIGWESEDLEIEIKEGIYKIKTETDYYHLTNEIKNKIKELKR